MERRSFIKTTGLSVAGLGLAEAGMANSVMAGKSLKRPVCAFTKCLQFLNFDQIAEVLARLEFDGADITVRPGGQIEPENVKAELPKAVKTLQKSGVGLPMIVTGVTDANDPLSVEVLKVAADSGIRYYRMGWLAYDFKKSIQQNLDEFKGMFERLARLNEKLGIHGGYQNHSGLHLGAPVWDLYDLVKDVDPKYLGVQYDIRHAVTEGGYSWILGMKRVEPWIRTICIKDFVWAKDPKRGWRHQNVLLGEGMVKFDEFLKEYAGLKVEAPISIHFEYDLGGAETGKKETTMEHEKIYGMMKQDLVWLREMLVKNQIET
ncbi:MAG TPA: TIM barrel protein [Prolixibacteraceae bacterium]|nr:TIM barrel protein [Prolixibacteraceae bacterium]